MHEPLILENNNNTPSLFDDFFHMDLLAGPSSANIALGAGLLAGNIAATTASNSSDNNNINSNNNDDDLSHINGMSSGAHSDSSRASSRSPSGSFSQLPPTPPQPPYAVAASMTNRTPFGLPAIDEESMFTFNFDDASNYLKSDSLAALSSFDFMGSFEPSQPSPVESSSATSETSSSGPSSSGRSNPSKKTAAASSKAFGYAIDPQLVGTPAPSSADSSHGDDDERAESEDRDRDLDDDDESIDDLIMAPVKVGGKGKSRRGTLQSGGIVKKTGAAKENGGKDSKSDLLIDDWRPSPEEYAKMSSKEKRQLRNKISARNFRVRRKEYIHTLEGDIAERDRLIDAIRGELGTTKDENYALRQEIAALKKAILEGRASPMLPPPAPLSPISPFSPLSNNNSNSSKDILLPNTAKDLPTSPRLAAVGASSAFWGGQAGGVFGGFGGGITPVHTALIPEYGFNFGSRVPAILSGKTSGNEQSSNRANENINPHLNPSPSQQISSNSNKVFAAGHNANVDQSIQQDQNQHQLVQQILGQLGANGAFESFTEINPFTLKTLDSYRMQLWSRMALQQAQAQHMQQAPQSTTPRRASTPNNSALSGLASNLRPHYFTSSGPKDRPHSSTSSPFASLFPKHASHSYPTPPASPRSSAPSTVQQQQQQMQYSLLAGLAGQTILQKMGSAFWDAFSGGSSPSPSPSGSRTWDAEKVRRVIEGTAVLRVVDVEPAPVSVKKEAAADSLEESMRSLNLGSTSTEKKVPVDVMSKKEKSFFLCRKGCSSTSRECN